MGSHGVGETGPSSSSSQQQQLPLSTLGYALTTPDSHFFDHEGAAYFGELEAALLQGVSGNISTGSNRKSLFTANRPPTLEIFPSWPMRHTQIHTPQSGEREESTTDSAGSGQNNAASQVESESPVSRRTGGGGGGLSEQEEIMASRGRATVSEDAAGSGGADRPAASRNQEKKILTGLAGEKTGKTPDAKTLRRLAQNREAARKSRLRKKVL